VLVTAIAIYLATAGRHHEPIAATVQPKDAAVPMITAAPRDAAVSISITVDAPEPIVAVPADAPPMHLGHHGHRDAGVAAITPPIDAPVGEGNVDIRSKAGAAFALISIDGANPLSPPVHKKLAAGRHVIRFLDPTNGNALDTQSIELADGQKLTVIER
jgi:hypothetical protein